MRTVHRHNEKYHEETEHNNVVENCYEAKIPVPSVPKDPYEFTDNDETAPSEKGFRPIAESLSKVS